MTSHGWCDLVPFSHDIALVHLERVLLLSDGSVVHARLKEQGNGSITVTAESTSPLTAGLQLELHRQFRACLRLDEDLSPFYKETDRHPAFRWIRRAGAGRMLRAPTVFEDAVKMICTTNCTWALTRIMVRNIVNEFGATGARGFRAFPSPEAIARSSESALRTRCTTGYRAPFILHLARQVADGKLNIESWRTIDIPTEELFRQMRTVRGIGPYAAGNLLKLVGRYEYLGLDSWVRARYFKLHSRGRRVKDSTIEKRYASYGKWRGLIFWLEMTREFHDGKFGT